ncbi:tRNA-splicing endonuclease subunit Sen2 [Apiospora hydei]|uniref:tRNA-intron lyase n=1 Tax=Apiospora hydei TaxID=1337664 RepID=A0ABR1V6K1_9PEZI
MNQTQEAFPALPVPAAGLPTGTTREPNASQPEKEPKSAVAPAAARPPPLTKIHELPIPIRTFPLPSFYPSNPLSLIHVIYTWITQALTAPHEPSIVHEGIWSTKTRSVHVVDAKAIRALWEQGFYGKGHLSRSEPNWLKREQARSGTQKQHVAEEYTRQRREERQQMKWDRARKEQEAIRRVRRLESLVAPVGPMELLRLPNSPSDLAALLAPSDAVAEPLELLANGQAPSGDVSASAPGPDLSLGDLSAATSKLQANSSATSAETLVDTLLNGNRERPGTPTNPYPTPPPDTPVESVAQIKRRKSVRFSPKVESTTFMNSDPPSPSLGMTMNGHGAVKSMDGILNNGAIPVQEPSILPLGNVSSPSDILPEPAQKSPLSTISTMSNDASLAVVDKEHLQLTREEAFFLAFGLGVLKVRDEKSGQLLSTQDLFNICRGYSYFPPRQLDLQPDDPFLVQYAVYHHFRSLGWVVRPGIKFGCDWLLYNRGPAFSHAEFAISVMPSYSNPGWKSQGRKAPAHNWHWLHSVNRVQSTAVKTLVLVYVDIPLPGAASDGDVASLLKQYRIREFLLKRWPINRRRH